jgi:DNA helicase HerA-like ATPase
LDADPLQDQSNAAPATGELFGNVLSVRGSQASVGLPATSLEGSDDVCVTVGKFLRIRRGNTLLIGMVTEVALETSPIAIEQGFIATAHLDMMGEIKDDEAGKPFFQRGITNYPAIGDPAALITNAELRLVYDMSGSEAIDIGHLQQDVTIDACVNVDEMLSKHFAILGATGVGKSSGVALILRKILEARPDLRIFLLDGHNEYARCFGDRAQVLNPRNLKLPFWLFNFEETIDVIFAGRPGVEEETVVLAELIPIAKSNYSQYKNGPTDRLVVKRSDPKSTGYTADTPVPYRLADLVALRQLFRLPANGKPMTIMQLAGFPAEVVDSVVSVLGRMAFEFGLWSDGAVPLLFVCEEAHRYASADRNIGFGPTRKALSRIAKEGRKYGVFLGLVTQRPAELDSTIISQCSTLFAMRMANERDQALVRSAVSDAAANLLAFVPSLGTREVLAFGEGVALPTRLKFKKLPPHLLPQSEAVTNARMESSRSDDDSFIDSVVERWRGATMSHKKTDESADFSGLMKDEAAPLQPTGLDPDRFKILKKRPDLGGDAFAGVQAPTTGVRR